jgi:chromosome segregation ATPase
MADEYVPPHTEATGASGGVKIPILFGLVIALIAANIYLYVQVSGMRTDMSKMRESLLDEVARLRETSNVSSQTSRRTVEELRDQLETARRQLSLANGQARSDALRNVEQAKKELQAAQAAQAQVFESKVSAVKETAETANTRVAEVGTEVTGVKSDVAATRSDLEKTIADLKRASGDLNVQSGLIATNGKELAALRALGERNYFEFKLTRGKQPQKVGDVLIELKKSDPKHNRYTLEITADDKKVEKKDRTVNEPLQFYTTKAHQPYEIVVNDVQKNLISGYLATPKVQSVRGESSGT